MSRDPRLPEAQFFQPNQAMLPEGPARPAEVVAASKRNVIAQRAVNASRDLKDALVVMRQLDRTGNFDAALDNALQVQARMNAAMEQLRIAGITFLAEFDGLDSENAA